LFFQAARHFGPVDILVNNAAMMEHTGQTATISDERWRRFVATNVNGLAYCTFRAARTMAGRGGAIVNISTVGAARPHHGMTGYDATKAVTDALTRSAAIDLIRLGIRVNAVAPGRTFNRQPYEPGPPEVVGKIPIGRNAHVEEIASVAAFLSSRESSYIVGQTIFVDGGLSVQLTPPGQFV
jgi:NAD(P)-dependent dehydrogenase (short-subunit alcohol dehydrogenase family)